MRLEWAGAGSKGRGAKEGEEKEEEGRTATGHGGRLVDELVEFSKHSGRGGGPEKGQGGVTLLLLSVTSPHL